MNVLLWTLQILAAILYGASGVMKVFMFDKVSEGVPSFGALPRDAWKALGILELLCVLGLIVPAALYWQPALTVVAAAVLTIESLVRLGARQVPREHVHHLKLPAGSPHGVHRVRPDGREAVHLIEKNLDRPYDIMRYLCLKNAKSHPNYWPPFNGLMAGSTRPTITLMRGFLRRSALQCDQQREGLRHAPA
jgi:hypothetical protein